MDVYVCGTKRMLDSREAYCETPIHRGLSPHLVQGRGIAIVPGKMTFSLSLERSVNNTQAT